MADSREHWLFTGEVQGVGFRYELVMEAKRLGICGWVRNLETGQVEAIVQGPKEKVDQLRSYITNPREYYIKELDIQTLPLEEECHDFKVFYY